MNAEHNASGDAAPADPAERALMTDLAEALAGPDGQAVATHLSARFAAADARLAADMARGAAPARFAAIAAIRKGLGHAGQVLKAASGQTDKAGQI